MSLQDRSAGGIFASGGNIQFPRFRCCVSAWGALDARAAQPHPALSHGVGNPV